MNPHLRNIVHACLILSILATMHFGLEWNDRAPSDEVWATDSLAISVAAPVQHARGPWGEGETFTLDSAGIPVDVAPTWHLTSAYATTGAEAQRLRWDAHVVLRQVDAAGRIWWSDTRPLQYHASETAIEVEFDAQEWVERANRLAAQAQTPGRVEILVHTQMRATVLQDGASMPIARTASVAMNTQGLLVTLDATDGSGSYYAASEVEDVPAAFFGSSLAAAVFGGATVTMRRRSGGSPQDVVPVTGLSPPSGAVCATPQELARMARRLRLPLLVDKEHALAVLWTDIPMYAQWPEAARGAGKRARWDHLFREAGRG